MNRAGAISKRVIGHIAAEYYPMETHPCRFNGCRVSSGLLKDYGGREFCGEHWPVIHQLQTTLSPEAWDEVKNVIARPPPCRYCNCRRAGRVLIFGGTFCISHAYEISLLRVDTPPQEWKSAEKSLRTDRRVNRRAGK